MVFSIQLRHRYMLLCKIFPWYCLHNENIFDHDNKCMQRPSFLICIRTMHAKTPYTRDYGCAMRKKNSQNFPTIGINTSVLCIYRLQTDETMNLELRSNLHGAISCQQNVFAFEVISGWLKYHFRSQNKLEQLNCFEQNWTVTKKRDVIRSYSVICNS